MNRSPNDLVLLVLRSWECHETTFFSRLERAFLFDSSRYVLNLILEERVWGVMRLCLFPVCVVF